MSCSFFAFSALAVDKCWWCRLYSHAKMDAKIFWTGRGARLVLPYTKYSIRQSLYHRTPILQKAKKTFCPNQGYIFSLITLIWLGGWSIQKNLLFTFFVQRQSHLHSVMFRKMGHDLLAFDGPSIQAKPLGEISSFSLLHIIGIVMFGSENIKFGFLWCPQRFR